MTTDLSSFPQATLCGSGGSVKAVVFLPDAEKGFYRATRFDWSGMVGWVQAAGHSFYGPWRTPHDPLNYEHGIGPCEEFGLELAPPLWNTAQAGEGFVKIGVGVLQKPTRDEYFAMMRAMEATPRDENIYEFRLPYRFLRPGQWDISQGSDWIEFRQRLAFGPVGYDYTKRISLAGGAGAMLRVEHALANTGTLAIATQHYCHNFIRIDDAPIGRGYRVSLPFDSGQIALNGCASVAGREIVFTRDLDGRKLWTRLAGFDSADASHAGFTLTAPGGGSVTVRVDRPPAKFNFYAERTAACPEPFTAIDLPPGRHMQWTITHAFA
jgi:hypothetical protein